MIAQKKIGEVLLLRVRLPAVRFAAGKELLMVGRVAKRSALLAGGVCGSFCPGSLSQPSR